MASQLPHCQTDLQVRQREDRRFVKLCQQIGVLSQARATVAGGQSVPTLAGDSLIPERYAGAVPTPR